MFFPKRLILLVLLLSFPFTVCICQGLELSPDNIYVELPEDESSIVYVTIWNGGDDFFSISPGVNYLYGGTQNWIPMEPYFYTIGPDEFLDMDLTVRSHGLLPGYYEAGLIFSSTAVVQIQLKVMLTTGIPEHIDASTLYPVPANEKLCINYEERINKLEIINFNGQVVYNNDSEVFDHCWIDTSEFGEGMYLISGETENGASFVGKFMVIH